MLAELLQNLGQSRVGAVLLHNNIAASLLLTVLVAVGPYLCWRLWRFVLAPLIWPQDPKQLPYWIPFFGHAFEFVKEFESVYKRASKQIKGNEPYAITLAGTTTVVVRNYRDLASVWRQTEPLHYDPFVSRMVLATGISPKGCERMFAKDAGALVDPKYRHVSTLVNQNPQCKSFIRIQSDWFKEQLLPGPRLKHLQEENLAQLCRMMDISKFTPDFVIGNSIDHKGTIVSLNKMSRYVLSRAAFPTFFGEALFEMEPDFAQIYQKWEDDSWKVFYNYPHFMAPDLHAARKKLIKTLGDFFELPDSRKEKLTWLFHTLDTELIYLGLDKHDRGVLVMMIVWAVNNNAHYICFWIMIHLLCDTELLAAVREETSRAFNEDGVPDLNKLLTECPQLEGLWNEALRMYNASTAVRKAVSECYIGGKRVNAGDQIFGPVRELQLDPYYFGEDADKFNSRRWVKDSSLPRSRGFHPFGGGTTYCPGRYFAQSETVIFVALAVNRFDIQVVDEDGTPVAHPQVPNVEMKIPSPAAMRPEGEVYVRVRDRA